MILRMTEIGALRLGVIPAPGPGPWARRLVSLARQSLRTAMLSVSQPIHTGASPTD